MFWILNPVITLLTFDVIDTLKEAIAMDEPSTSTNKDIRLRKTVVTRAGGTLDICRASDSEVESSKLLLLPEMLLLRIFSYLSARDKCRSSRVCKTFRRVMKDQELWRFVDLTPYTIRLQDLSKLTRRYLSKSLRVFAVRGFLRSNTIKTKLFSVAFIQELLARCPTITSLTITDAELRHLSSGALPRSLEELHLISCQLGVMWLATAMEMDNLSNLKCLDISGCGRITNKDIATFEYGLRNLRELNLLGCYRLTDRALEIISSNHVHLTSLLLGHADFSDAGIQDIALKLKELQSLTIQDCGLLTDTCLKYVETMKAIKELDILDNLQFSPAAIYSLVRKLPKLKRITVQNVNLVEDEIFRINPNVEVL